MSATELHRVLPGTPGHSTGCHIEPQPLRYLLLAHKSYPSRRLPTCPRIHRRCTSHPKWKRPELPPVPSTVRQLQTLDWRQSSRPKPPVKLGSFSSHPPVNASGITYPVNAFGDV